MSALLFGQAKPSRLCAGLGRLPFVENEIVGNKKGRRVTESGRTASGIVNNRDRLKRQEKRVIAGFAKAACTPFAVAKLS